MSKNDEKYVLSIDLGTSGSKMAVVSVFGEVVDFDFEAVQLNLLPGGGAEQDPREWWRAIMATAKRLLSRGSVPAEDIVAVCASTQWSGTVAVDEAGRPLMNAVIWMDMRGEKYVQDITAGGPFKVEGYGLLKLMRWVRMTGGAPGQSGKEPVGHILFIKNEFPDVYEKTYKFLEPRDYINLCLTGEFASSYDAITLHWVTDNRNLEKITYHDKLIEMTGLERDKLPDLKRAVDVLGPIKKELAGELGLREDVQVVMGSPDIMAAAVGSGAVGDYEGHAYIGTSSWIVAHVPFKKTDILHGIASIPSSIPDKYIVVNEQEIAGGTLNYLRDNILYHKDALLKEASVPDIYKVFDGIAAKVPPGSNKVIFTPWLNGEKTPVEDNAVRACLYNLSLENTREDVIRAFFEGVAFNQRWALTYVEKFIGRKMDPIHLVGGGASSDIWCQIHADVFDRTVKQVEAPIQTNARGTAFIAAVGLGYLAFDDIPKYVKIRNTYEPNPETRGIYDDLFGIFLDIYNKNKKIYKKLNAT
ncbi:MAG: FGGY-family carbohydrate kinase [Deltaproteobacteria bacterium]|nr:FGGY-family carbohydrate kinase [Deltaproteobacteria bacterium]